MTTLVYHTVDHDWRSPLAVTPEAFESHARWLSRHRVVLPLDNAVDLCDAKGRLPRRRTALTFDDGFSGLYKHAFPTLLKYELPATVFLVAQTLDGGQEIDWSSTAPDHARTMCLDEVLEMQEAGVHFGSHSYSHLRLTSLSEEECIADLRKSREFLEDLLRRPVRSLSYPRGLHNEAVRTAARKAGFSYAVSLPEGREPIGRYAVPRAVIVPGNGLGTLGFKSSRWYMPLRVNRGFPALRSAARRLGVGMRIPS